MSIQQLAALEFLSDPQLTPPYLPNSGTSINPVANTLYVARAVALGAKLLTGIACRIQTVNGNIITSLYTAAGVRVAASAALPLAGGMQGFAFAAPVQVPAGVLFLGVQFDNALAAVYGAEMFTNVAALAQGAFAAPASITPPTFPVGGFTTAIPVGSTF